MFLFCFNMGIPGVRGTLIFSYMHRLVQFWNVQNFLNFNIFGGFQKSEFFGGYKDFMNIFWGHHEIGLYLGVPRSGVYVGKIFVTMLLQ